MSTCNLCGGRGTRVIAAISDPHFAADKTGRVVLARSFAIPIVVPCLCAARRAAEIGVSRDRHCASTRIAPPAASRS